MKILADWILVFFCSTCMTLARNGCVCSTTIKLLLCTIYAVLYWKAQQHWIFLIPSKNSESPRNELGAARWEARTLSVVPCGPISDSWLCSSGLCRHRRNICHGGRSRALQADVVKTTSKRRSPLQSRLHRCRLHQNEAARSLPSKSKAIFVA